MPPPLPKPARTSAFTQLIRPSALLCALFWAGCLELSGSTAEPCGGRVTCSAPRACVDGRCLGSCLSAEDCEEGERCDRQLCVPIAAAPISAPDMSAPDMTP